MKEHLTTGQIDDFRERRLSPSELFAVGQHLGGCAACRAQIESVRSMAGEASILQNNLEKSAQFPEHLSYEQLSALTDDSLAKIDREIAEGHLSICSICERESIELRAFAASLESGKTPIFTSDEPTFWEKIRAFVFTPAFGASFAAILIFAVLAGIWLFRENPKNEIVKTENPPSPTATPANNQILNQNTQTAPTPQIIEENNQPPTNANKKADEETSPRVVSTPKAELAQNTPKNDELSAQDSEIIRRALENKEIETPKDLKNLFAQTGGLMGNQFSGGVPFKIETPTRVIINETQPVLRWQNLAEADEYRVGIYDENFNEVAKIQNLTANQWRVSKPLKRGAIYVWEVEALKNGNVIGTAPATTDAEAKFKILEAVKSNQLQRELRKNPRSALWKGIVYAKFGLLSEAEREFVQYSRENPNSSQAKDLLNKIRALRK